MAYERIVKKFYDSLEEGKLVARKCTDCGSVEFPPVFMCNECGSANMEWIEVSGKAKVLNFTLYGLVGFDPVYVPYQPYAYAEIQIEEGGPSFLGIVRGITKENKAEMIAKLPIPVKAVIIPRDGFKSVIFEIDE